MSIFAVNEYVPSGASSPATAIAGTGGEQTGGDGGRE
jgi:hypothetical protein